MGDLDYADIAARFKSSVKAKDRWFRMKLYKDCFIASEAVNFLVESGIAKDRDEAVIICRKLQVNENLFKHVVDDQLFKDEYLFFRFNSNIKKPGRSASTDPAGSTMTHPARSSSTTSNNSSMTSKNSTNNRESYAPDPDGDVVGFAGFVRKMSPRPPSSRLITEGGDSSFEGGSSRHLTAQEAGRKARASSMVKVQGVEMPEEKTVSDGINDPFESVIKPNDMRCLALVAHNHMKPAMKAFIEDHSEIIKKFRLTGTNTTISMCKAVFGPDNPDVVYGPTCTSGPLGGDAQLCALMCLEEVGAIIFFMDPLTPHPHQADIDSLVRLANVHNVMLCPNPATGFAAMWMLRNSLGARRPEMIPSFFETLQSPCVPEYMAAQEQALARSLARN